MRRAGARTLAQRAYERLAALLRAGIDAEPEPETTALYDRVSRSEQS